MKRIAIIGPCLPNPKDSQKIIDSVGFLKHDFLIDYFDPLEEINDNASPETFFAQWQDKIMKMTKDYDCFMGFSLGGAILKKSLNDFNMKPSILFSTPILLDKTLSDALNRIIHLLKVNRIVEAINLLNQWVHYPLQPKLLQQQEVFFENETKRLSIGLNYVLNIQKFKTIKKTDKLLHFVGSLSKLVSESHIPQSEKSITEIVPDAGMRVLENNPHFCQSKIIHFLRGHGLCLH